jgi:hypothetical protein
MREGDKDTRLSEQEVAGHKLSDSVLDRLPTLTTMNPGRKISYAEVIAFHNSET